MQQKFRISDDAWQAFCNSLPENVNPSEKLREMVQSATSPLDYVFGVEDAAEAWGLAPGHIENLCAAGKVKAKKIGEMWILDKNQPNPAQIEVIE
ncbi:MerR family transcriptional regulator [Paenibacillus elgii]|uniref:helix-turn-helix domain-containing protein n=1 Tax=Paenibacillus elgii TaxID=189691 RepID=UPI0013D7941B|nr:helix-turn-helix domain-containing protein [Paenibacillus elgii]